MIITVNGLKVYYEAAGEGEPVVLLHGWGADSSSLRPVLKRVRESLPVRAIAPDFPGFGYSDPPGADWSVGDYAQLLEGFLDALSLPGVTLVAHSFGGRVAIKLAAHPPERIKRLVLVDSAGIRPKRGPGYYVRVSIAKAVKLAYRAAPGAARALHLGNLAARQASSDYRNTGDLRGTFVRVVNEDLSGLLPAIRCPTLLIWGDRDTSTPLADGILMQRLIPGARLVVIRGAGHFAFAERPTEFGQALIPFLMEGITTESADIKNQRRSESTKEDKEANQQISTCQ